nr:OmpA family protein [Candidatus Entotheonella palauensis]
MIHKQHWQTLPDDIQGIIEAAASQTGQRIYAQFEAENMKSMAEFEQGLIKILPFPQDVIQKLSDITSDILKKKSENNPIFREIYQSYHNFQKRHTKWSKNAYAFENWQTCGYLKNYQILELETSFKHAGIGEVTQNGEEFIVSLKGDIVFNLNSSTIPFTLATQIKRIAHIMLPFPSAEITVEGYTDFQGFWDYNIKLSQARANTVKKLLADEGFEGTINAIGKGPTDQFGPRATDNRRAEVTITHSSTCH